MVYFILNICNRRIDLNKKESKNPESLNKTTIQVEDKQLNKEYEDLPLNDKK